MAWARPVKLEHVDGEAGWWGVGRKEIVTGGDLHPGGNGACELRPVLDCCAVDDDRSDGADEQRSVYPEDDVGEGGLVGPPTLCLGGIARTDGRGNGGPAEAAQVTLEEPCVREGGESERTQRPEAVKGALGPTSFIGPSAPVFEGTVERVGEGRDRLAGGLHEGEDAVEGLDVGDGYTGVGSRGRWENVEKEVEEAREDRG